MSGLYRRALYARGLRAGAVWFLVACPAYAQTPPATGANAPAQTVSVDEKNVGDQILSDAPKISVEAPVINLNVTPRRITFDRNIRSAVVYVFNQGKTATIFDVSLIDRVMLPSGQIRTADQAGSMPDGKPIVDRLQSARAMVMATPRRVTLAPGKGQAIRLRAMPPPAGEGAASTGEYRTHLTVTNIPPPDTGLTAEQAAGTRANGLTFQVRSMVAISIPVIVRTAAIDARARIDNAKLTQAEEPAQAGAPARLVSAVGIDIARLGASSLFGTVEVRGGAKGTEQLGLARGVGVYPEIASRSLQILLKRAPRPGEKLTIVFIDDDGHPGAELARISLDAR